MLFFHLLVKINASFEVNPARTGSLLYLPCRIKARGGALIKTLSTQGEKLLVQSGAPNRVVWPVLLTALYTSFGVKLCKQAVFH